MKKVVITTDSSSDIPADLAESLGVDVVPLSVLIGESCYWDGVDINADDIYSFYDRDGLVPKTAAVTPSAYYDFFKPYLSKGCAIVHICLSSAISSTYQNAVLTSGTLEDVYPVDSQSLHTGILLQVLHACSLRDKGMEARDIAAELERTRDKVRTSFIVSRLDYLVKGGRCSALTALGANILSIRPSIEMTGGELKVAKKYRGKMSSCYVQYAKDVLAAAPSHDRRWCTVSHSGIDPQVLEAATQVVRDSGLFDQIIPVRAGCTISSHCGPDTLSVVFMEE